MQTKTLRRLTNAKENQAHIIAEARKALRIRRRQARKGLRHL